MAKRKLEQRAGEDTGAKRTKKVVEKIKKNEETTVKGMLTSEITETKATSVRIVIGSYEKVLCGIDAKFPSAKTVTTGSLARLITVQARFKSSVHVLSSHRGN